jgi:hypothetical protein
MTPLRQFLNARRATTNLTHLSLAPSGKYSVTDADLPDLYRLIAAETAPTHVLETHNGLTAGPLLIDLDFEYPEEPRFHTRQYTADEIDKFIECIHEAVTYFYGPLDDVEYVVSEKPSPTVETKKRVKDGLHVVGRNLILSYKDQLQLRLYALEKHFLQSSFDTVHVRNDMSSVYDIAVIQRNAWYLMGCSKPDRAPYLPTRSYWVSDGEVLYRSAESRPYTIADLSIRCGGETLSVLAGRREELEGLVEVKVKKKSEKRAPTVKNTLVMNEGNFLTHAMPDSVSEVGKSVVPMSEMTGGRPSFVQTLDALTKLVDMWSPRRADDYAGWRNCVFCIATCAKSCGTAEAAETGLSLAHAFVLKARGADRYDAKKVEGVFHGEKSGKLGFIVAHQWARADNLAAYMSCALEFRVNEKTPLSVVYHKYLDDMGRESKESISNEEFGKRMRRCYELRNCRNSDKDGMGQVNRIKIPTNEISLEFLRKMTIFYAISLL